MQRNNHSKLLSFTVLALLGSAAATAQPAPGFYVSATLGQSSYHVGKSNGIVILIGGPFGGGLLTAQPDAIKVDDGDLSAGAVLGYRINPYLAAEVSYLDFGSADVAERFTFPSPGIPFLPDLTRDFSVAVSGPALSVLGSLPLGADWSLFLRGGVLFADEKIRFGSFARPSSTTYGDKVLLGGVGADWSFAQRWSARIEYQRTGNIDSNVSSGEARVEQVALSVLFRL